MKEKDIWLTPKEVQLMLQGSLQWKDVESHSTSARTELRKLREPTFEKAARPRPTEPKQTNRSKETNPSLEKEEQAKKLEGKPVVWLLGSVGLLTVSSWFYFLLFSK